VNKQQKRRRAKVKSHRQAARRGQEGVRYYKASACSRNFLPESPSSGALASLRREPERRLTFWQWVSSLINFIFGR